MTAPSAFEEIEIIIENTGGGARPPVDRHGDGGGDPDKKRPADGPAGNRYVTAVVLAIVSITVFFLALVTVFLLRKGIAKEWVPVHLPVLIWVNTAILLASSRTLEMARKRLAAFDYSGFRRIWTVTTALGVLFLAGQIVVWLQLAREGIFIATNPASSFFYIFSGAHAVHLLAGVGALIYVALRQAPKPAVSLAVMTKAIGYYWHFLDALWLCLFMVLSLGR